MSIFSDDMTLQSCDPDDFDDCLITLEKSFNIRYEKDAFAHVKTFGDVCDIIESHINYPHHDSCTSQQAFYKIRESLTLASEVKEITLETNLEDILPRKKRRKIVKTFRKETGLSIDLHNKGWLTETITILAIISIIAFFFKWQLAICLFSFTWLLGWVTNKFVAKELQQLTVRQLTEKVYSEHYLQVRRQYETINRKEIITTIQQVFTNHLGVEKPYLIREAPLL